MRFSLWYASDGNGGFDLGASSFTLASVRNIRAEDGAKVADGYKEYFGEDFDPERTARLFRAAPALLRALEGMLAENTKPARDAARAAIAMTKGEA